jgi:hypothetical protein
MDYAAMWPPFRGRYSGNFFIRQHVCVFVLSILADWEFSATQHDWIRRPRPEAEITSRGAGTCSKWLVFFTPKSTAARLEHMGEEEAGIGTTTTFVSLSKPRSRGLDKRALFGLWGCVHAHACHVHRWGCRDPNPNSKGFRIGLDQLRWPAMHDRGPAGPFQGGDRSGHRPYRQLGHC